MLYKFEYGDWSKDGHNVSDYEIVRINKSEEFVINAFVAGCKKLGLPFDQRGMSNQFKFCDGYEDSSVPEEYAKILIDAGFDGVEENGYMEENLEWVKMWLFVANVGDPFEYEIVVPDKHLVIGGYGLFY